MEGTRPQQPQGYATHGLDGTGGHCLVRQTRDTLRSSRQLGFRSSDFSSEQRRGTRCDQGVRETAAGSRGCIR
eukprot:3322587-Rhodomonas_salina.1